MGLVHWVQLAVTEGLGPVLIRRMLEYAGSAEKACMLSRGEIEGIEGMPPSRAGRVYESLRASAEEAEKQLRCAEQAGARVLCLADGQYPALLKCISDPPPVLFVLGSLEDRDLNSLAMVGSRRCSHYGKEQAERFAAMLAGAGLTIVSGGARGVDSAAHRGALRHPQGRTICVLGSGLDVVYPPENGELFRQIARRGALLSEFAFGVPPSAENFPRRNRVISGLSRGVLVVEADDRSGAMITARLAADDHNRPVFALPGRVDNPMSSGPHRLIREGAILVSAPGDVLDGLDPLPQPVREPTLFDAPASAGDAGQEEIRREKAPGLPLSERQRLILESLAGEAVSVDHIIDCTGLPAAQVLQELTFLSLKGLVKRVDGQMFARTEFQGGQGR